MKLTSLTNTILKYLNESQQFLNVENEKGTVFKVDDHSLDTFFFTNSTYDKIESSKNCSLIFKKSVVKELNLKNGSFNIETSMESSGNKIDGGVVKSFNDVKFDCTKTTMKGVVFEDGNNLTIYGEALKLRSIKIKNVKNVVINLKGNCGKLNILIENCGKLECKGGRDVICSFDKFVVANTMVKQFDFGKFRDKVQVEKLVFYKGVIEPNAKRSLSELGVNNNMTSYGITSIKDALKDKDYNIIII